MEEIVKILLKDDKELYKKYLKAERRYYKKLGDKYSTIKMEIDLDEKVLKNLFKSLAKTNICFDELMTCLLKAEIVRKEMEEYEKTSKHTKNMEHRTNRRCR